MVKGLPSCICKLSIINYKRETYPERLERAQGGLTAATSGKLFPDLRRVACDADALMDSRNFTKPDKPTPTLTPETNGRYRYYVFDRQKHVRAALLAAGVQEVDYDLAT